MKSNPLKGEFSPLSTRHVEDLIGGIIRSRPVKAIAKAAGRPIETVRSWRRACVPDTWTTLINLMAADDEVYQAVISLAGRGNAQDLTTEEIGAVKEILKALGKI